MIEKTIEKMEELFGGSVANPEHCPVVFSYQVKLAAWMLQQDLVESKDPQSPLA
jgi:hypothetical protein